jgi:purine-nucleoside phosphorylase
MSTVPEVIVARSLGLEVCGLSCITNLAAGRSGKALSHEEVLETTKRAQRRTVRLIERFIGSL